MAQDLIRMDDGNTPVNELVKEATGFDDADTMTFLMIFDVMMEKMPDTYEEGKVNETEMPDMPVDEDDIDIDGVDEVGGAEES
tara:strand:- start:74246 stop:74494 length:249 start_codon:yes stop_codon:yes gene_type:complete